MSCRRLFVHPLKRQSVEAFMALVIAWYCLQIFFKLILYETVINVVCDGHVVKCCNKFQPAVLQTTSVGCTRLTTPAVWYEGQIVGYWSRIIFFIPHLHLTPSLRETYQTFAKARMAGIPGVAILIMVTLKSELRVYSTQGHWEWHYLIDFKSSSWRSTVSTTLSCVFSEIKQDTGWKSLFFIPQLHVVPH